MPHHSCLLVGTVLLVVLSCANAQLTREDNSINNLSSSNDDDFEVDTYPKAPSFAADGTKAVTRRWGIPDTEAKVGRLFSYPIPADAFDGDVASLKFPDLPSWLWHNGRSGVVEGTPEAGDVGDKYVSVRAEGAGGGGAKDTFCIKVEHVPESELLKEANCFRRTDDLTVLSIIVERSRDLTPRDKVNLIREVARFFDVDYTLISLSQSSLNVDFLSEESAIMAGPGSLGTLHVNNSSSDPTTEDKGQMQLQWSVGCNGEINKEDQDVIINVEYSSRNGSLSAVADLKVYGWIVNQVNPSTKRVRRQADFSGDFNTDDDDYDYNYDGYFDEPTEADRASASPLATPVFPESLGTVYPGELPVSPIFTVVPISTPVYVPVKPTIRVVEASPTLVYDRTEYPDGIRGGGGGRDPAELESSLLTHPTTSADYTTPLSHVSSVGEAGGPSRVPIPATTSAPTPVIPGQTTQYTVNNFPPRVNTRINKLAWVAGNVYRLEIPKDTFVDVEDGTTRDLTLVLKDEQGQVFSRDSWIQFDPVKQEVYALPLEKHIGRYHFALKAIDKDNESVTDNLEISVWQHNQARIFHHQFTATLKLEKKFEYEFAFSLDWQVKVVEKIAALFKDSVSSINVRNISMNPVQLSWTNTSLVDSRSTMCPTQELKHIKQVLQSGRDSDPSRMAKRVFLPEFQLKRVLAQFFDPCEKPFNHDTDHVHRHPFTPLEGGGGGETAPEKDENSAPIIRNQVDLLKATVGRLIRYQVPYLTCYDLEDGDTRKLHLSMLTIDLSPPAKTSWLQFDSANQEFFGIPLHKDVGRAEYLLECVDEGELSVSEVLIVEVEADPLSSAPKPVTFSLTLDTPYKTFMSNAHDKARFMERLGQSLGDPDARYVSVRSIESGSVRVEWYNNSLSNAPCPEEDVRRIREVMTDDNGHLRQDYKDFFRPEFRVSSGSAVVPSGSCLAGDTPTYEADPDTAAPAEDEMTSPRDEDYLLTFIIPAVIIAFLLLVAALIACCLYRRRRYGKMSMAGDRTFVSKGIPIIFAEELDDNRPDNVKSPVIMKEEKPPLPPPEYQRNSPPPPRGDTNPQAPPSDDAPYHRPPPFTASNGGARNPTRPNLPPAYRKPPTYVPP